MAISGGSNDFFLSSCASVAQMYTHWTSGPGFPLRCLTISISECMFSCRMSPPHHVDCPEVELMPSCKLHTLARSEETGCPNHSFNRSSVTEDTAPHRRQTHALRTISSPHLRAQMLGKLNGAHTIRLLPNMPSSSDWIIVIEHDIKYLTHIFASLKSILYP